MRLPNFLIIGAMRAGTTTLYRHLEAHPDVFLPQTKEPNNLCADEVLTEAGRRAYAGLFRPAGERPLAGEASTAYTKRPEHGDVAGRARQLLGPALRLVYIVRHPVERIRSQHHHQIANQAVTLPLERAVREDPRFLDYSRYAMQLEPWLDRFGPERLLVVRFENYVVDTAHWYGEICRFLGADPTRTLPLPERAFNKTANRPSLTPLWKRLVFERDWYKARVRPLLPRRVRELAAARLLPRAPAEAERLSPATRAWIWERLGPDAERFEGLMATVFRSPADGRAYRPGS